MFNQIQPDCHSATLLKNKIKYTHSVIKMDSHFYNELLGIQASLEACINVETTII